ncbi:MAG: phage portal protein [Rhodobacterales bacterium RIFCSPHIGHO2_02_FULL_62_130]|nr:MAG: phage portal protein [Rhodobacterales bacterium RIFCSPHIGHO2_02_FULL_62_130]OHC56340.1 MAG: phage portal protein [Rhodobacterales bacterium RIFCSPHIGHO2_12_FULL_62_75]
MKTPRIISRLFKPETKGLADPTTDLLALFGLMPTQAGVQISAPMALDVAAVGSAIRVISEAAACLDVMVKAVAADGTETNVAGHPLLALLKGRANDWTSGFELIRDLVIDALSDDRGGLVWVNRVEGRAAELIRYRSGVVTVDVNQNTGEPSYRINNRPVPSADMIHLRAPFGRSPLTMAREAIGVAYVLQRHAANLFGKGARPSGALSFPSGFGEASVKKAIAAWRATHEADGESGKTAILYDGTTFVPITFNSTDAQFLENRKFQILEIARAFRVPPSMLFDLDRATWGNTEQLGKEFLTYCLEPWLRALEGALTRALLGDEGGRLVIRFDRDDMTRADLQTRATTINSLISSETINANEARSWIGLGPRAGGNVFKNPNISTEPTAAPVGPKGASDATE